MHPPIPRSLLLSTLVLGALLAPGARPAGACPARLSAATLPTQPNGIELGLGATNANAAVGGGGLTATLSRCGEVTSLKWPGPSFWDQLQYVTSNAPDARARDHLGALPEMGAFAGLAWQGESDAGFTWLRDAAWEVEQSYTKTTSGVVRTVHRNEGLGIVVRSTAFVLPGRDVLVLRHRVERLAGSPVVAARLVAYANFAPTRIRLPWFPVGDTGLDYRNDFALAWDARQRAFLHFRPGEDEPQLFDLALTPAVDAGALEAVLQAPPADPAALQGAVHAALDTFVEPGIYLAFGARDGDPGFQAGFDDAGLCAHQSEIGERALMSFGLPDSFLPLARSLFLCDRVVTHPDGPLGTYREADGWTWQAQSAYHDAADGVLSGSPLAAGHANAALSRELAFEGDRAQATFYVAAARTRDEAWALLAEARGGPGPATQQAAADAWWEAWLAPAALPDTDDPAVLAFARRALISLRTATDARTGAMMASVAAQPPYGLDWPRDGAFLNYALDVAGYPDLVTRHNELYVGWQRTDWERWSLAYPATCNLQNPSYPDCVPPGTWEMNYYALDDRALPGGPFSFEIDTTGLAVWTLWQHARFLEGAERAAYLAGVCDAIARGATALAECDHPDDPDPRLQCLAAEDDNLELTQGLQGAETTHLALTSALEAQTDCGFDPAQLEAWSVRRNELGQAIVDNFHETPPGMRFRGHFLGGRRPWVIWPTRLLLFVDARMSSHAAFIDRASVQPVLAREAPVLGYNAENMLARAQLARALDDQAVLDEIADQVRFFVRHGTTPGTLHMAEFAGRVPVDLDGDGTSPDYLPQNDVPHVWQQAYLYTVAMLAFGSDGAEIPLPAHPPRCGLLGVEALPLAAWVLARRRRRRRR